MDFLIVISAVAYSLAMLFIILYSGVQAHLLYRFKLSLKKGLPARPADPEEWPLVTVQLPVYNEKKVINRLLDAVAALDYPTHALEIQVLDDSSDGTSQYIQEIIKEYPHLQFQHLQRTDRAGFKAGALKFGLARAHGNFIAIFDADFVPDPAFLKKTIPFFRDDKTGMVQTRWTHLNKEYSLLTRLQAMALDVHFYVEQVGRNSLQSFINFNGTAGVWRKETILDAGNWQSDTLTEDLDLSYRAQLKGWQFTYLPQVESPAELPPVMSALKSQQFRWTKGGAESAVKHLRQVTFSQKSLLVKLHGMAHLLNSSVFVAVLVASLASIPLLWAKANHCLPDSFFTAGLVALLSFVVIGAVYQQSGAVHQAFTVKKLFSFFFYFPVFLAVSMGMALHNSVAVYEGWTGRKSPFIRTPKFNLSGGQKEKERLFTITFRLPWLTYLEAGFGLLFLCTAGWGLYQREYGFLVFHVMLAAGYLVVFYQSVISWPKEAA